MKKYISDEDSQYIFETIYKHVTDLFDVCPDIFIRDIKEYWVGDILIINCEYHQDDPLKGPDMVLETESYENQVVPLMLKFVILPVSEENRPDINYRIQVAWFFHDVQDGTLWEQHWLTKIPSPEFEVTDPKEIDIKDFVKSVMDEFNILTLND